VVAEAVLPGPLEVVVDEWRKFNADPSKHPMHLASVVCSSGYVMALAVSLSEVIAPGAPAEMSLTPALFAGFGIGALYATLLRYANVRIWAAPKKQKTVVITGSARGIGKAMAREFLLAGDKVVITSRSERTVASAVRELRAEVGAGATVYGVSCDVTSQSSVARLASISTSLLGDVDVWINNAANSGSFKRFTDLTDTQLNEVVRSNLLGSLYCSRAAFRLMAARAARGNGGGHIFNMDGAGADGTATPMYAAYGATKAAIGHLMGSLQAEAASKDLPIGVHTCSPGMVLTNLLLEGATLRNKQVFNILCEHPETAAGFLVPRIRSVVALDKRRQYIQYLTPSRALSRFLTAPLRAGRFFDAEGQPGYLNEYERVMGKGAEDTRRLVEWVRRRDHALVMSYSATMACTYAALVMHAIGTSS